MHDYIGALVLLAICVASNLLYGTDHKNKDYANGEREAMASPRSFELVYHWIRVSTLIAGLGALLTDWSVWLVVARSPLQAYLGCAFAVLGFVVFAMAKRTLGRHYSPCYDSHVPTAIVQTGVYGRIRHPIYTANLITLSGLAAATGSLWMVANVIVLAVYYVRSAVHEERALAAAHPEYAGYVARSGRFLPSVFRRAMQAAPQEVAASGAAVPGSGHWMRPFHYSL